MKRYLLLLLSVLTISNTFAAEVITAYDNIKARNMYVEGNMINKLYQRLHVTLVNEGMDTFCDGVRLIDTFVNGTFYVNDLVVYDSPFTIQPNEEKEIIVDFCLTIPAEHRVYVVAGNPLEHFNEPNPIPEDEKKYLLAYCDIKTIDWTPRNIDAEITIDNSLDRNGVMTTNVNYVAGRVKLINNDDTPMFQKWFYLTLTKCPDGDVVKPKNELAVQVIAKELLANQIVETPFAFDETSLEDGQRYALSVKYSTPDGRADTTPLFFTYENPTGIKDIKHTSATPKLYDLSGKRLTREPERGVYIKDGRKVVIK